MRVRSKSYVKAICDEVQLANDAKKIVQVYQQKGRSLPLGAVDIQAISQQYSPDLAARVFYEGVLLSGHNRFIQQLQMFSDQYVESLEKQQSTYESFNNAVKIMVVPGMFYKEHPETGADGKLVQEIARKFGFETEFIGIKSGGSVSDNSAIIEQALRKQTHPNIWLVSISKGSSDVRHFFQHSAFFQDTRRCKSIRGWINVAGIPKGLPYVDYRMSTFFRRWVLRSLGLFLPFDYQALVELQTTQSFWKKQNWPKGVKMIHLVPVPHSSHIQGFLSEKYQKTLIAGPNDGLVPLTDNLDLPGHIYPLWAYDHFMRSHRMSAYLYQLFNYITDQAEQAAVKTT